MRVEPITEEDAEWAGAVITESRARPARWKTTRGERQGSLSLGDGLTLAVAQRLGARAVSFDSAWAHFPTLKLPAAGSVEGAELKAITGRFTAGAASTAVLPAAAGHPDLKGYPSCRPTPS